MLALTVYVPLHKIQVKWFIEKPHNTELISRKDVAFQIHPKSQNWKGHVLGFISLCFVTLYFPPHNWFLTVRWFYVTFCGLFLGLTPSDYCEFFSAIADGKRHLYNAPAYVIYFIISILIIFNDISTYIKLLHFCFSVACMIQNSMHMQKYFVQ